MKELNFNNVSEGFQGSNVSQNTLNTQLFTLSSTTIATPIATKRDTSQIAQVHCGIRPDLPGASGIAVKQIDAGIIRTKKSEDKHRTGSTEERCDETERSNIHYIANPQQDLMACGSHLKSSCGIKDNWGSSRGSFLQ